MTNTNKLQDFGFGGEEFEGELNIVPYTQFINANNKDYGIAITPKNAELAQFELTSDPALCEAVSFRTPTGAYGECAREGWQPIEHEFADGTKETLLVTKEPRMLILNRSQPLMGNEVEIIAYNKVKFNGGGYKAFSYIVVWFLNDENKPISELPFRLKCSGYSGITFLRNYDYYNNLDSFCQKFLATYKSLTGDRAIDKNNIFYAHAVYSPKLIRKKATSSVNGQSSFAVQTESFVIPTNSNFASLIIKNGSPTSDKIKELIETTKPWLKVESTSPTEVKESPESQIDVSGYPEIEFETSETLKAEIAPPF